MTILERSAVCNVIWHQTFTAVWSLSLFLLRIRAYVGIWTFCCVWFEHSPFLQYNSCDIYDMYTELYLVYLATTRLDPHLISDLPYIFVAQIYHGVTQLLQICHPSWEFSIPSHPIPSQRCSTGFRCGDYGGHLSAVSSLWGGFGSGHLLIGRFDLWLHNKKYPWARC